LVLADVKKTTVLHELARGGFLFQVTPLITSHMLILADINGVTPLHECAKRGELIQLKTLDLSIVALDQRDAIQGKTALHLCAERDDADGCRILLDAGADPKVRDKQEQQAHQLPKTPVVIEQLGGNPLAITLRRKAEMEMELRALKIEQLTATRAKRASLDQQLVNQRLVNQQQQQQVVPTSKNTIIRINPNKFPNGLVGPVPGAGGVNITASAATSASTPTQQSQTPTPPPVVVQTVPQVTPPPVVMHPPVFAPTTAYQYHRSNQQATQLPGQPSNHHHHHLHPVTQTPRVVLPQDLIVAHNGDQKSGGLKDEKKPYVTLELPQDAKPKIATGSGSESENNDSDSGSDNGQRKRGRRKW